MWPLSSHLRLGPRKTSVGSGMSPGEAMVAAAESGARLTDISAQHRTGRCPLGRPTSTRTEGKPSGFLVPF